MAPPKGQDFASMTRDQLLDEQLMQQILSQSVESGPGTPKEKAAAKAEFDSNLQRISEALGNITSHRPAGMLNLPPL